MNKPALLLACLAGAVAVGLGAFGAHGLKTVLSPEKLQTFETAVKYQFYHAFALIACAILAERGINTSLPSWLFVFGILFFSGSLYLLACNQVLGIESWRWLGPVTPVGGLCFILGWIVLFVNSWKA